MSSNIMELLNKSLDRIVPIADPDYIIGEDYSLKAFDSWVHSCISGTDGFIGTVVLGQIGNGKTHFLRYVRRSYLSSMIGVYVPNMFISGPFVDALNEIYKTFFYGPGNHVLKHYYLDWQKFKDINKNLVGDYQNDIIRYLLQCNNQEEAELVLDYFSNQSLFPDQQKFLRNKFGAKKNFITNESDFAKASGEAFEFIQLITGKPLLILFDEVDKVYSSETKSVCLTRVGTRILTSYRVLFDHLNVKHLKGIICIGATPEAWDVLSKQTAFERRFKDRKVVLKVPKSKEDCTHFILKRLQEIEYDPTPSDIEIVRNTVRNLSDENMNSWADVISAIKTGPRSRRLIKVVKDPATIILEVLDNSISPLTWGEIISKSAELRRMYGANQPTPILSKLEKEKLIKSSSTNPKTYESLSLREEFDDDK